MQLVILAAGMGSRFGGLKQMEPMDEAGNFLLDYSVYDAKKAGFDSVVFIIKKEFAEEFKNKIIELTSEKIYNQIESYFDKILESEEKLVKINAKILSLEDGHPKAEKLAKKLSKEKENIAKIFLDAQNLIIKEFFDKSYSNISNLEELEDFRKRLYKELSCK